MPETLASYMVPEHHVKQYTANVRASLNKEPGLLMPYVTQAAYSGEKSQVVNFLGPIEFTERDTPYEDTKVSEVEHTQRWITGREFDCAVFIDKLDTLKMLYDPQSPYVERMREAYGRKTDELIMSAFYATAKTGKDGTTNTAFPGADEVAHGGTRMSVDKLRAMRKLLKQRHVNLRTEQPYIAVTAEQADDLLGQTQVTSSDYNAIKTLVDGEVSRFMGFMFVPYEDNGNSDNGRGIPTLSVAGPATIRQCPVWVRTGMHYGWWDGLEISVDKRPDKNNIRQLHANFTAGTTRVEEGKVMRLNCVETGTPS